MRGALGFLWRLMWSSFEGGFESLGVLAAAGFWEVSAAMVEAVKLSLLVVVLLAVSVYFEV